jgi:hypothetical protein
MLRLYNLMGSSVVHCSRVCADSGSLLGDGAARGYDVPKNVDHSDALEWARKIIPGARPCGRCGRTL